MAHDVGLGDRVAYDAFISYSHEKDHHLAPRLREAVQSIGRVNGSPGPSIFLDESALSASPALWSSITAALDDSSYLVLLASPEAARSEWVDRELRYWLETKSIDSVLQVLTSGDLAWDTVVGDFNPSASTALAPALAGRFHEEPRFVDLRWASDTGTKDSDRRLRLAAAQIAAPLVGASPDVLADEVGTRARRESRRRRATWAAMVLLAVALVLAALWGIDRSSRLASDSTVRRATTLAQQAAGLTGERPDIAALAAVEAAGILDRVKDPAARQSASTEVRAALLATTVTPPRRELGSVSGSRIVAIAKSEPSLAQGDASARHEFVAALDDGGAVRVWDLRYGSVDRSPVAELDLSRPPGGARSWDLSLTPDGTQVAVATAEGVQVVSIASGDSPRRLAILDGAQTPIRFTVDGAWAIDSRGALWDMSCGRVSEGCGIARPVWHAPADGVTFADLRWNPRQGLAVSVWADSMVGTTITRREWALTRGGSGLEIIDVKESSFSDERCQDGKCSLLSFGSGLLLDLTNGPRSHTLALATYTDAGWQRLPSEVKVPYEPVATVANPRGVTPNDAVPDRYVVLADRDGNLFTQTADMHQGIGSGDSRIAYANSGDVGVIDSTGTFLVAGDRNGAVHLFDLSVGLSFVNAGISDEPPMIPVEGSDLILRATGQSDASCCTLTVSIPTGLDVLPIGQATPAHVRAVACGTEQYIAVPNPDGLHVYKFPQPASALIPRPTVPADRSVSPPALACEAGGQALLLAAPGVGVRRIVFGASGPVSIEEVKVPGCCPNPSRPVMLTSDGEVVVFSRGRGKGSGADGPDGPDGDLNIFDLGSGKRLDGPDGLADAREPVTAALPTGQAFVVGRGPSVSLVTIDGDSVTARKLVEVDAPVEALAVDPDGAEVMVATTMTMELVSISQGGRIGAPLRFSGLARYAGDGALWLHPYSYRNPMLFARVALDVESLSDWACDSVRRNPEPAEWNDVAGHQQKDVCTRGDAGRWRAVDR